MQVYFLQQENLDEQLAHLRRRHKGFKLHQVQTAPPDEGYCTSPAGVHNVLQDPEYPPPAEGESEASPDAELEIKVFGQNVTSTGPPCSFCGFKGN